MPLSHINVSIFNAFCDIHAELSLSSPRRSSNSLLNVRFDFGRQWYTVEFLKLSLLQCNSARPFLMMFTFVNFVFREKHGQVRNDFLDCMMGVKTSEQG